MRSRRARDPPARPGCAGASNVPRTWAWPRRRLERAQGVDPAAGWLIAARARRVPPPKRRWSWTRRGGGGAGYASRDENGREGAGLKNDLIVGFERRGPLRAFAEGPDAFLCDVEVRARTCVVVITTVPQTAGYVRRRQSSVSARRFPWSSPGRHPRTSPRHVPSGPKPRSPVAPRKGQCALAPAALACPSPTPVFTTCQW